MFSTSLRRSAHIVRTLYKLSWRWAEKKSKPGGFFSLYCLHAQLKMCSSGFWFWRICFVLGEGVSKASSRQEMDTWTTGCLASRTTAESQSAFLTLLLILTLLFRSGWRTTQREDTHSLPPAPPQHQLTHILNMSQTREQPQAHHTQQTHPAEDHS